jgi:hypothetical protein
MGITRLTIVRRSKTPFELLENGSETLVAMRLTIYQNLG